MLILIYHSVHLLQQFAIVLIQQIFFNYFTWPFVFFNQSLALHMFGGTWYNISFYVRECVPFIRKVQRRRCSFLIKICAQLKIQFSHIIQFRKQFNPWHRIFFGDVTESERRKKGEQTCVTFVRKCILRRFSSINFHDLREIMITKPT